MATVEKIITLNSIPNKIHSQFHRKDLCQLIKNNVSLRLIFIRLILEVFNEWAAVMRHHDEIEEQKKIQELNK